MWFSAIKLAVSAGSKIYANKQKTKMAMSDAQLMHASKMAAGTEAYQGKLLEARQSDWKGRGSFDNFKYAHRGAGLGSHSDDPTAMDKVKLFFEMFSELPKWFHKFMDPCRGEHIYGIKGTQIFKNGGKKMRKDYRQNKMGGGMMRSTYSKGTVKPKDKKLAAMYGDKNKTKLLEVIL